MQPSHIAYAAIAEATRRLQLEPSIITGSSVYFHNCPDKLAVDIEDRRVVRVSATVKYKSHKVTYDSGAGNAKICPAISDFVNLIKAKQEERLEAERVEAIEALGLHFSKTK